MQPKIIQGKGSRNNFTEFSLYLLLINIDKVKNAFPKYLKASKYNGFYKILEAKSDVNCIFSVNRPKTNSHSFVSGFEICASEYERFCLFISVFFCWQLINFNLELKTL